MNSLQELSNALDSKLTGLRLSVVHPLNKNKVFVLLEGNTDIKLFRNIFSNVNTDIIEFKGKKNLIEALETLINEEYKNIIGIKDADFDNLEEVTYPHNLFMTDYHDMEIEMIERDGLSSLINEFSKEECYDILCGDLKNDVYNIAIEIGYIRWYSERENGLFNFKKFNWNNLLSYDNCHIIFDIESLSSLLLAQLDNSDGINIQEEVTNLKALSTDKLQICNGHDMTLLIANYFPIGNINDKKIEEALRLSYHFSHFKNTNLFQNLNLWANANNYQLFDETHN